ncbi:MAG: HYR domain-containing protein, partial [Bacteroidales bacterium]|nr:HYR domain-containing protein [Bacteroidales bacterium]
MNQIKNSISVYSSGQNQAAPELICPEDISTYTDINDCTSFIASGLNPVFDETEVVTLTWEMFGATSDASPAQGINLIDDYTFDEGTTIITYTATGTDGTTATCTFTVTISDNQVPRLESIPADITIETAPGACSATVYWIEPTANDNCTAPHLITKESTTRPGDEAGQARPGDEFPVGATRVYYTAYDAMGNASQPGSFTITVKDAEPPALSLPADVTLACGDPLPAPWQTLQQLFNTGGSATDNCSDEAIRFRLLTETTSSPVCPYVLTRTYQATDAAGNTATAEHRIV